MSASITTCPSCGLESGEDYGGNGMCWPCYVNDQPPGDVEKGGDKGGGDSRNGFPPHPSTPPRGSLTFPKPLAEAAYCGLAGDFVRLIEPHTEADPAAVLIAFLTGFGNAIGRGPRWAVNGVDHATNLYVLIVGRTSAGRKGTAVGDAMLPLKLAKPDWAKERMLGGLSTGEGLVHQVRDSTERITDDGESEVIDPGVLDKRLMVIEPEFAQALKVMAREGNTLSPIVRALWDGDRAGTLTKASPTRTTGALVSIIGQISAEELRRQLRETEIANGFMNRFMVVCAQRSRALPRGGNVDMDAVRAIADQLRLVIDAAGTAGELGMTEEAWKVWDSVYEHLTADRPGLQGALCARAHAIVRRLAVIYALLDLEKVVGVSHLKAALAVWDYAEASARFVFGDRIGDRRADRLLAAIREAGHDGLSRAEIRMAIGSNNVPAEEIDRALETLLGHGLVQVFQRPTSGRPQERWRAVSNGRNGSNGS